MQMIDVKAADLTGLALDWAVAKVEGVSTHKFQEKTFALFGSLAIPLGNAENGYTPSSCWHCGGPLLAKHFRIVTGMVPSLDMWPDEPAELLPWVMRKIVEFELGEEVSVPAELVSQ